LAKIEAKNVFDGNGPGSFEILPVIRKVASLGGVSRAQAVGEKYFNRAKREILLLPRENKRRLILSEIEKVRSGG
jgi:hypothetical protein